MNTPPDPRPALAASQEWFAGLIEGLRPDQYDDPTPCTDWTIRQLIEHQFAVQERTRRLGVDGVLGDAPRLLPLPEGDVAEAFRAVAAAAAATWTDDRLSAIVSPPWGDCPGFAAVAGYTRENLVHGWDLAVASGQPSEADPAVAGPLLESTQRFLPAEPRGGMIPFDPVVESAPGAGATERLANWLGHTR